MGDLNYDFKFDESLAKNPVHYLEIFGSCYRHNVNDVKRDLENVLVKMLNWFQRKRDEGQQ